MSNPAEWAMFQRRRRDEQLQQIFNLALQAYQMKRQDAERQTQNQFEERRTRAYEMASMPRPSSDRWYPKSMAEAVEYEQKKRPPQKDLATIEAESGARARGSAKYREPKDAKKPKIDKMLNAILNRINAELEGQSPPVSAKDAKKRASNWIVKDSLGQITEKDVADIINEFQSYPEGYPADRPTTLGGGIGSARRLAATPSIPPNDMRQIEESVKRGTYKDLNEAIQAYILYKKQAR